MTATVREALAKVLPVALVILGILAVAGASWVISGYLPAARTYTDPREGTVYVPQAGTYKVCDGTTLIYGPGTRGQAAVPGSPECVR